MLQQRARVLVVDDDPVIRQSLQTGLRYEGFEVLEAKDGDSALRLATGGVRGLVRDPGREPLLTRLEVRVARLPAATMARVTEIHTAHTADLDTASLKAARALLDDVFEDMTDHDWEHALGGVHALVWEGTELIGHASVVQRRLLHRGRALRAGYIEGVAVRADRRGLGRGTAMMEALERVVRGAYDLGALGASDEGAPFYARRGWKLWQGPSSALTPNGIERTAEDDGGIYVLPVAVPLDLSGELTCDWRDGDVW